VDHDGVVIGIEDDDLKQTPVSVGADDEHSVDSGNGSQGFARGMEDVFVGDPVLTGAVGDLHRDKLPCQHGVVKVTCHVHSSRLQVTAAGCRRPATLSTQVRG
jgi:hypothetical protein